MIVPIFLLWILQTSITLGSLVIDKLEQDGVHYEEYCPKMQFCPEGAHVMCMYYDPNVTSAAGPKCRDFKNISISYEVAEKLVDLVNEIRGKAAMGKETGKGNESLPRAYGLFKLKWDNELATFAQVLANTCYVKRDLCRATSRFPDPGQEISVVRFSMPQWFPVAHLDKFKEAGLSNEKIEYAAKEGFKGWYIKKQLVTADMIKKIPDFYSRPATQHVSKIGDELRYLQLIDSGTTHMGCGLSAYAEYAFSGINVTSTNTFNSVHIVCNFSAKPQKGTEAYKTENPYDRPGEFHYSKCGCPVGTEEDEMCLCSHTTSPNGNTPPTCAKDESCKPSVVLLPIFTVDDAPETMLKRYGSPEQMTQNAAEWTRNEISGGEFNQPREGYLEDVQTLFGRKQLGTGMDPTEEHPTRYTVKSIGAPYANQRISLRGNGYAAQNRATPRSLSPSRLSPNLVPRSFQNYPATNRFSTSRGRSFYPGYAQKPRPYPSEYPITRSRAQDENRRWNYEPEDTGSPSSIPTEKARKESIFSRVPKFSLPMSQNIFGTMIQSRQKDLKSSIKKDVVPRKDFTTAQQLVHSYLNQKNQQPVENLPQDIHSEPMVPQIYSPPIPTSNAIDFFNQSLPVAPDDLDLRNNMGVATNPFEELIESPTNTVDVTLNEGFDTKLMALLDTLEQEVKHIEMGANQKEIFDARIRKIYGTVVGKDPAFSIDANEHYDQSKPDIDTEDNYPLDVIEDPNQRTIDKEMFDTEDKVNELSSYEHDKYPIQNEVRPLPRDQSSLSPYEETDQRPHDFRNTYNMLDSIKHRPPIKKLQNVDYKGDGYHRRPKSSHRLDSKAVAKRKERKVKPKNPYQEFLDDRQIKWRPRFEQKTKNEIRNKGHRNRYYGEKYQYNLDDEKDEYELKPMNYYSDKEKPQKFNDYEYENMDADNLSLERRKYYQEKLDTLERKHAMGSASRRRDHEKMRSRRLMRDREFDDRIRPFEVQKSHYYMPDRAERSRFSYRY